MSDVEGTTPEAERVAELQARVAELEAQNPSAKVQRGPRWRTALALVLLIIGTLLTPAGIVALWAQRTVSVTDRYVATMAPLIRDEAVQELVATKLTDQLFEQVDVAGLLNEVLPPRADALAGPLESGMQSFVHGKILQILQTPEAAQAWDEINRTLQARIIAALKGDDSGAVTVQDDTIVLDTGDLIQKVKDRLVAQGFTVFAKVPIPAQADRDIVLLQSDQVKQASLVYRITEPLASGLIWVALFFLIVAILVANNRRRMTVAAGVAIAASGALVAILLSVGTTSALSSLGVSDDSIQGTTIDTLTRFLSGSARTAFTLGIIIALLAWLAGPAGVATGIRRGVVAAITAVANAITRFVPQIAPVGRFFTTTLQVWRALIAIVALFSVFSGYNASAGRLIWTLVFALIAWFVVEVLARTSVPAAAPPIDQQPVSV